MKIVFKVINTHLFASRSLLIDAKLSVACPRLVPERILNLVLPLIALKTRTAEARASFFYDGRRRDTLYSPAISTLAYQ